MQKRKRLGWVICTLLAAGAGAQVAWGADKNLEDRVRALEKQMNQGQQKEAAESRSNAAESKSIKERVDTVEKDLQASKDAFAQSLGFDLHAFVATGYNYNFNQPESRANRIHVFDEDADTFVLDQANINIQRNKPEGISFNIDVDFGKTAEVVGRATRWSSNPNSTESTNSVELRQAYVKYTIAESPFSVEAGKFVTFHGAEIIKSYNNFNFNISNSILFGFSIPFSHTGVFGTYAFGDLGSISIGGANGWDAVSDNNDGKSIISMLTLTPIEMVTFALPVTYGAEQDNDGRSKRLLITPLLTIKPIDMLTLIFEYDYGNESNVAFAPGGASSTALASAPGNAMWSGAAGYVVVAPMDDLLISLRGEVFDDPDGVRTLFQQAGYGPGATFWEITPTVAYKITDGLTWRAEYRHDESDKAFFDKGNRNVANGDIGTQGQDIIATELIYAF